MHISTIQSTWKQHGFFDQRNYTNKIRGNNVDFPAIEITSKKVRGNNVDFLSSKITLIKVRGNNVYFSTIEIYIEKSTWKQCGFFDHRNYIEKVRGNDVEIRRNLVFDVST